MTPTQIKLAACATLAVAAVIEDQVVTRLNKKRFKHNLELGLEYQAAADALLKQNTYLLSVLERNEVPMSEFDLIVLNDCIPQ